MEKRLGLDQNGIYTASGSDAALSYPNEGNDFFYDLEETSFWFKHRNRIIETLINKFPFKGNFADIGGGNGYQIQYLKEKFPDKTFYLIEPNYAGCLNARKRGIDEVYSVGFSDFPFIGKNVDGVGLFDVIEHIEDDVAFLSGLRTYLPTGSILYLTTPAFGSLWSDVDDYSGHFRRYTRKTIGKVMMDAGWTVDFTSYFFSYLPPLVWTLRCLPYKIRGSRSSEKIKASEKGHHSGSLSEKILAKLHKDEPKKLEAGYIRTGSSVLVVATKK
ncbi:MAG: methyltransferase domain-containing protein [Chitinophagaceae bacterium]